MQRLIFAFILTLLVFVIADLDDPRQGGIRVDHADQILKDIPSTMH